MLPATFWEKHFIYKEKSGASKTKSSTENLRTMLYESFILEFFICVLEMCSYCGDKKQITDMSVEKTSGYK